MVELEIENRKVEVFRAKEPHSPVVYLNTVKGEGKEVYSEVRRISIRPFSLVAISNLSWNSDMVPWSYPALQDDAEPFYGGADAYLKILTEKIIPTAEDRIGQSGKRIIAGYSLAGLFAIYSLYKSDQFSRSASASGSLWFPMFKDFVFSHNTMIKLEKLYLSLGDKEKHTSNPYLKTVEENTIAIEEFYQSKGIETKFVLNPGNHYKNTIGRMADAIAWLLD